MASLDTLPKIGVPATRVMKAFAIREAGSAKIELAEVPVPSIDSDEILVRVHAIGVGIHDS